MKIEELLAYFDNGGSLTEQGMWPLSQEEYQAAETIANVLRDHKLDTSVEEFETRPWGVIIPSVLVVIMFVCLIVAKFAAGPARMVTLLIALLMAGITIFVHYTGSDILRNLGPTASSQNVIAIHRATGSKVVLQDGFAQEFVALFGSVAPETVSSSHLVNSLVHGFNDSRAKGLGNVSYAE